MTSAYAYRHSNSILQQQYWIQNFVYNCSIMIGWNIVQSDFIIRCPIESEIFYYLPFLWWCQSAVVARAGGAKRVVVDERKHYGCDLNSDDSSQKSEIWLRKTHTVFPFIYPHPLCNTSSSNHRWLTPPQQGEDSKKISLSIAHLILKSDWTKFHPIRIEQQ